MLKIMRKLQDMALTKYPTKKVTVTQKEQEKCMVKMFQLLESLCQSGHMM